jgi:hypothetical protein
MTLVTTSEYLQRPKEKWVQPEDFGAVFMLTSVSDAGVKSSKKSSPRANDNGQGFLSRIGPVNTGPKFYSVTHGHRNTSVNTDGSNNNPLLSEPFSTDLGIYVSTL